MRPPLVARTLLLAVAGAREAEFVSGDLEEEFAYVCETRDRAAGNRWYCWQVVRSVAALLGLRMRSGELTRIVLGSALGVALPLLLLDRLWCFVYSQIPLKDGFERDPVFLAINLVCVAACASLGGWSARREAGAAGMAVGAAVAAILGLWASTSAVPWLYGAMVTLAATAGSVVPFEGRRWR